MYAKGLVHMLGMPKDSGVGISDSAGTNLRRVGGPYELGGESGGSGDRRRAEGRQAFADASSPDIIIESRAGRKMHLSEHREWCRSSLAGDRSHHNGQPIALLGKGDRALDRFLQLEFCKVRIDLAVVQCLECAPTSHSRS